MALTHSETFNVSIGRALGRVILTPHGELDAAAAPILEAVVVDLIEEQGNLDVIINLAQLEFMDSRGLSVLLSADRMAKERGGTVTLSAPRPRVQRLLDLTGLAGQLTCTKT